jgi:hypothetical protein
MSPWLWLAFALVGGPPTAVAIAATIMVSLVDRRDRPRVIARLVPVLAAAAQVNPVNLSSRISRRPRQPAEPVRSIDGAAAKPTRRRAGRGGE